MANTTLYFASLLSPSDILCNSIQTSSHLAPIVASNNSQQPKLWFYLWQNVQLILHYASPWWDSLSLNSKEYTTSFLWIKYYPRSWNPITLSCQVWQVLYKPSITEKLGSYRLKVLTSMNPPTSIYNFVSKICLLLRVSTTLLDFQLLCFKINV